MIAHQYPLDLLPAPQASLENFVPGPNGAALAAVRDVLAGRGPAFVHLWGGVGSGRSHLLAALARAAQAQGGEPLALGPVPFDPQQRLYLVDDVHTLDEAGQAALFLLQDGVRQNPGAVLVSTADAPPAHLALREDVRSRLAWGLVFALYPIPESDQAAALLAYARARGARVDEELIPYMLTRLPRDMRTQVFLLDALDRYALARQRALTIPLLREWLQQSGFGAASAISPEK